MKDFDQVPFEEQKQFLNSFDHVLCDIDGVIWLSAIPIPGASSCIKKLKEVGKEIVFVTNSPFETTDKLRDKLSSNNLDRNEALATPAIAMISYLKSVNFNKQIYIVGTSDFKEEFRKAGYSVAPDPPQTIGESFQSMYEYIQDDTNIGAVIIVYDYNLTGLKLQKALTYLKRNDCIYIRGGDDKAVPIFGNLGPVMAYHHIFKAIKELSGKDEVVLSKPSTDFAKYVMKQFHIENSQRVLFIGDSVLSDIAFGKKLGFKTLLVLSGLTKKEDVVDWKFEEYNKPNYYIEDMNTLGNLLQKVFNLK